MLCGHFAQTVAIRRIGRAHHHHHITGCRQLLHRLLAVGGGIANIFLVRAADIGETRPQRIDDSFGFINRQRGLAHVRQLIWIAYFQISHIRHCFHQQHAAWRQLPHSTLHFRVTGMADHDDLVAVLIQTRHFAVHLGNQRASGIKHAKTALRRFLLHRLGYAVRRINQRGAGRHICQFFDKNSSFGAQIVHHEFIVHHFVPHINRRAKQLQCPFHNIDGTVHPRAKAARIGQHNGFRHVFSSECGWSSYH